MLIAEKNLITCMNFKYPNTSPYERFVSGNRNFQGIVIMKFYTARCVPGSTEWFNH